MAYYNRNGEKLNLDVESLEFLNGGECAKIAYIGENVLKKYYDFTEREYRLTPQMFDLLSTIDNKHLMKIYDVYSEMNLLKLLQNKIGLRSFVIDAYVAKYYHEESIDVLCEHKDYLLDNFGELEKLFEIFTDNGISTGDIGKKNAILNSREIVLIDPDAFYAVKTSSRTLSLKNKKELLFLFKSILLDSVMENESCKGNIPLISKKITNQLTNFKIDENTNITSELSKRLNYVKKPIDYLIK